VLRLERPWSLPRGLQDSSLGSKLRSSRGNENYSRPAFATDDWLFDFHSILSPLFTADAPTEPSSALRMPPSHALGLPQSGDMDDARTTTAISPTDHRKDGHSCDPVRLVDTLCAPPLWRGGNPNSSAKPCVHRIMDGEAVEDWQARGRELKTFELS
jgi:hypothetical protein